ncbi:DUF58 domain-containing protein [bacterium]|nr:DUF58 domain-containing protein [bacterium]
MSESVAYADTFVGRARTFVKLRAIAYAAGLLIGLAALGTGSHALLYLMALVLLSPAAAALVTRAAKTQRARLTLEGRLAFVFAIGFLAAALNTGMNLLYFLSSLLIALVFVSVVASSLVFRSLFVRRRAPSRVSAGERLQVDVSVRNQKRIPTFALLVAEARTTCLDPATKPAVFLAEIKAREQKRVSYETRFLRRGEQKLLGIALETRFPFGLVAQHIEVAAPQTVLVTPAVFRVRAGVLDKDAPADAAARRLVATDERRDVVRSLRDYRPGDHPRAIHWKVSARRGALVVKDFERTEPKRALVVLDSWVCEGHVPPEDRERLVEEAVSLAASVLVALQARGEKVGLAARVPAPLVQPPERSEHGTGRALAVLARLEAPADRDLADLARQARRAAERSRVVIVTTRPEEEARQALLALRAERPTILALAAPGDLSRFVEMPA